MDMFNSYVSLPEGIPYCNITVLIGKRIHDEILGVPIFQTNPPVADKPMKPR